MKDFPHTTLSALGDFEKVDAAEMQARARRFLEVMARRHTIREFKPDPAPFSVIADCIATAGRAPSGANHQPWHFVAIADPALKARIRHAAEEEERAFYESRAGEEWLDALAPLGTDADKRFLETAPWLIAVFAQRRGGPEKGDDKKNYYINESVGIACGFLIAALHQAGLATLTHTPNPMGFLSDALGRPANEKPVLLVVCGYPEDGAKVPLHALKKKPLTDIMTVFA